VRLLGEQRGLLTVDAFISYTITGLFFGAAYAIAASGLVLTYTTTRVFNLAHGATSMVMAYLYWQLHVDSGLPAWLSVVLVLFVIAPLYGVLLERLVMRRVFDAPVSVMLVMTLGLFLFLIGIAQQVWPADTPRYVSQFFGYKSFPVLGAQMYYHYLITIVVSAVVAAGLYFLLNRTRIGTAMRAAVDNRELLELFGARANRVSMLSWAIGSSLAGLAGVLLVARTGLDYYSLTFLVINAFAAAMLGRLRSLPMTYLGAILLGLAIGYSQYVRGSQLLETGLQFALPTLMLFLILIFVPEVRLRVGQVKGILAANVPSGRRALAWAAVLVLATIAVLQVLSPTHKLNFGDAVIFSITMLSLVLLTGYGGFVSLSQFTFVGVGAAVACKMNTTSPLAILVAVLITAAAGALVALPVLRLTGLYLALATLAFGQLMDYLVFNANFMFGFGGTLPAKRVSFLGYDFDDTGSYVFLMTAVFVLLGIGLLAVRRGTIGRLLIALRDSPAACATLGLNERWLRVAVFSASAGIAGLAGALYAGLHGRVGALTFQELQSLPLLLAAVVAGVTTVSGAYAGGILLMLLPVLAGQSQALSGLEFLVLGGGAILLSRDPNGLVNLVYRGARAVLPRLPVPRWLHRVAAPAAPNDARALDDLPEAQVAGHGVA
jgi:branched-chain amino acid transport system permease protein